MTDHPIPIELQRFLSQYIRSVEQLEILCLLVENPDRAWSAQEVFKCIQSSQQSVTEGLHYFTGECFFTFDETSGFRFSPKTPELLQLISDLVKTYRQRRVTVVEWIYLMPSDPIRQFANAFKFRKDQK